MPCLLENQPEIFDTQAEIAVNKPSDIIENERRLFYVALTRARKAVYIGAKHPDKKSNAERLVALSLPKGNERPGLRGVEPVYWNKYIIQDTTGR